MLHTYDCKEILKMKETNPAKKNNSQPPKSQPDKKKPKKKNSAAKKKAEYDDMRQIDWFPVDPFGD